MNIRIVLSPNPIFNALALLLLLLLPQAIPYKSSNSGIHKRQLVIEWQDKYLISFETYKRTHTLID